MKVLSIVAVLVAACLAASTGASWPLVWDSDGRSDTPIAARLGPDGELYVLVSTYIRETGIRQAVLLRIDETGNVNWTGIDTGMFWTPGMALRPDGSVLIAGKGSNNALRVTSFANTDGSVEWSRSRSDITWTSPIFGPHAQPIWSQPHGAWLLPAQIGDDFAVIGWSATGEPLPDWTWTPPEGEGGASSVASRPDGGLIVAGSVSLGDLPTGWWVVASDAAGAEIWRHFDDGDTSFMNFTNAFLLEPDGKGGNDSAIVVWADDETDCGLFSLRLWSLDVNTGNELWSTSWPPPGDDCHLFRPQSVKAVGDRIVATGWTDAFGSSGDAGVLSFEVNTGIEVWRRHFSGPTSTTAQALSSQGGSALVAASLYPPINPGPKPLLALSWDRAGEVCAPPQELLPAYVVDTQVSDSGRWLIIGENYSPETLENVVVQQLTDPCASIFTSRFETGDTDIGDGGPKDWTR